MIEVSAQLQGRSVFFAGEVLECLITVINCGSSEAGAANEKPAQLAWLSAQLHCQCSVSESRMVLPKSPKLTAAEVTSTGNETSFVASRGERGMTVLTTKPIIIFCDLRLAPGETKTYTYRETIPTDAPPSFKGQAIKYSYKVTIGTQRFDCPTKLLRVPFRVLVVQGLGDIGLYNEYEELAPSNPFLAYQRKESSLMDVALQVLQTITARKGTNFYNITNSRGKVARFCLFKHAYKIGEDIIGTCDFTDATIPCVQFSVSLQTEEKISEEYLKRGTPATTLTTYSKLQEFCLHTKRTHITVPIPLTATPGFSTDLVSLRWRLHFEFVTSVKSLPDQQNPADPSESSTWQGPPSVEVETMVWDLPIKVFPTSPMQATSVSLLRTMSTVTL